MAKKDKYQIELEKALDLATEMGCLDPVNMNSAEDIQERIDLYFEKCREFGTMPDIAGLANALGIKRMEFLRIAESGANDPRADVMSKAHTKINAILTALSKKSLVNPTMAIMDLANDFGYSRQGDVIIEKKKEQKALTAEQIAEKYAGLLTDKRIIDAEVIEKKPRRALKS